MLTKQNKTKCLISFLVSMSLTCPVKIAVHVTYLFVFKNTKNKILKNWTIIYRPRKHNTITNKIKKTTKKFK